MGLAKYHKKRDFHVTSEPKGAKKATRGHSFVIQKHAATRLHYDFRLEWDGVLKSWAVPKGPSLVPGERRLAVEVEDHPVEYADFEGNIPKGQYGGGAVIVWDRGEWEPEGDVREALAKGTLKFTLHGEKLNGRFMLVRLKDRGDGERHNWLLIKEHDEFALAEPANDVTIEKPRSVVSDRTIDEVAAEKNGRIWNSNRAESAPAAAPAPAPSRARPTPAGAKKAPLPRGVDAELATLVDEVPMGDEWLYELKLDGYRILATVAGAGKKREVVLDSRNGKDWTHRFPVQADAVAQLPVKSAIFDGELCFQKANGATDFQSLQNALAEGGDGELAYFVFDLLYLDGADLRGLPLVRRKEILAEIVPVATEGPIRLSQHVMANGQTFFDEVCRLGLEGIIAKRADSPYVGRRTLDWQKIKCAREQEMVVVGFTPPKGGRKGLGALLLGVHEDGKLRYAGKVGTGFTQKVLLELFARLRKLVVPEPAVVNAPRMRNAVWVKPELVGQVRFTEWTRDGSLRHPSFLGLREDKVAADVVREEPAEPAPEISPKRHRARAPKETTRTRTASKKVAAKTTAKQAAPKKAATAEPKERRADGAAMIAGVRVTHPDRVLDAESGLTKEGLAEYFASVGDEILRYAKDRPLALVRCPDGTAGETFFQKHKVPWMGDEIRVGRAGKDDILYVSTRKGLVALAQASVFEVHAWGAHVKSPETPDLIVMDLDPDVGLPWAKVADAALGLHARLQALGFESFVKTTGGKGLHVVVPIAPKYDWDTVRGFSEALALDFVQREPKAFTATMAKRARAGKIFIDYLRNGRGATAVLPYSPRARPGVPVAVPIDWSEVHEVVPSELTVKSVPGYLRTRKRDPWEGMARLHQRLTRKALDQLDAGLRS